MLVEQVEDQRCNQVAITHCFVGSAMESKMNTAAQMQDDASTPKRKRPEDHSSIILDAYKCPFDGIIAAKDTNSSNVTGQEADIISSCFEDLPYEQFLHVISYLGPSTSLTSMSCVSHRYNRFMRRIGDIMLAKAEKCFRCPLRSNDGIHRESSISIFVRYSCYCSLVHKRLEILDRLLSSSDTTCRRECKERPTKRFRATNKGALHRLQLAKALASAPDVDKALDIADKLISELSNSISSPDQHICCSRNLEARVLATVGKIGGVVFKQSKVALEVVQQEELGDTGGNIPADISQELAKHISFEVERIDKARVLMKKVVFYKLLFECNGLYTT